MNQLAHAKEYGVVEVRASADARGGTSPGARAAPPSTFLDPPAVAVAGDPWCAGAGGGWSVPGAEVVGAETGGGGVPVLTSPRLGAGPRAMAALNFDGASLPWGFSIA